MKGVYIIQKCNTMNTYTLKVKKRKPVNLTMTKGEIERRILPFSVLSYIMQNLSSDTLQSLLFDYL